MGYGMLIDLRKCSACQSCAINCKVENNVPVGTFWREITMVTEGSFPNLKSLPVNMACQHCDNAPCVNVCPVTATYKREDGIVVQDYDKCVGCKYCMVACPYEARSFNWEKPFKDGHPTYLNPDVPVRPKHVVEKCTFCVHRADAGKPGPACVEACPTRALVFGDIDDPTSEIAKLIKSTGATVLHPEFGTKPRVYFVGLPASLGGGK